MGSPVSTLSPEAAGGAFPTGFYMGVLNISSLQIPMTALECRTYSSHFVGNGTEAQGI